MTIWLKIKTMLNSTRKYLLLVLMQLGYDQVHFQEGHLK